MTLGALEPTGLMELRELRELVTKTALGPGVRGGEDEAAGLIVPARKAG